MAGITPIRGNHSGSSQQCCGTRGTTNADVAGDFSRISLWRRTHFSILKCDTRHSFPTLSEPHLIRIEHELATLPYLYALRAPVLAHVTTCSYQGIHLKSKAAASDWF